MANFLITKDKRIYCKSLGMNDFVYNRSINMYQTAISIPSLTKDTKVSVVIYNHPFSFEYSCFNGGLIILTNIKPYKSIMVKTKIES